MTKETVKIVIIGHIDHGKSTLIGRLLLDTNSLPKGKLAEIKKISKELGREAELAYLTDQLKEEREKNITIDTTQIFFNSHKRNYVIIDAPGHVEFIKNMITGASLAEAAVLIIDVNEGMAEQTTRHAYIATMLGIDDVIVIFNKMDLVDYSRERFEKVKGELVSFMENLGVRPSFLIPTSAKQGDNILKTSANMSWYEGPGLLQALDGLNIDRESAKKPLRFPVQDIYEIDGEKIIVGKVVSGIIKQDQQVILFPSGQEAKIKALRIFQGRKKKARQGENIGLTLAQPIPIRRGDVIVGKENTPRPTDRFKGNIFWMVEEPLQIGKTTTLRCATQEVDCIVEKIETRIDSSTLQVLEENANQLELNEAGTVIFKLKKPLIIEKFSFIEELGRFVIERQYNLQGAGIIITEAVQ